MKKLVRSLALAAIAASVCLSPGTYQAQAQQKGNFDPAEFQKRMLERMRESFDVKDDGEWKLISERIQKVTDARREVGGGFGGFTGGRGPGGPGGAPGGDNANAGDGNRRPGGFGGRESNPDQEALQKAIQDKAPTEEIKAKLAKLRESRKEKEAKLEKAQEDLKQVLSVRQEAVAVMFGLLK
jgi:hypothetical protein